MDMVPLDAVILRPGSETNMVSPIRDLLLDLEMTPGHAVSRSLDRAGTLSCQGKPCSTRLAARAQIAFEAAQAGRRTHVWSL